MTNTAQSMLIPPSTDVLLRVAFLYVGQGSSALVLARNGSYYEVSLVDINMDRKAGGIDVPRLVRDLMGNVGLKWFINTHPHDDHLLGVEALQEEVTIHGVQHSGHKPGRQFQDAYKQLENVIKKVKDDGGKEVVLLGSRSAVAFGEAQMHVLAPAAYVTDEVNDETPDTRYNRIHEQCAVIKFGDGVNWIMIAGDADHIAFKDHITPYHKDRLGAYVLAASHHGSRTFFMAKEGDDPYLDALNAISPSCVVVSAPTQNESRHDHPHDEAMELYENAVGVENVLHTGQERFSYIFDIYADGTCSAAQHDNGKLAEDYGLTEDDDDGGNKPDGPSGKGPFISTSSRTGDLSPRKFG
ncbi:MAG: hypothetical protein K1X78_09575 [Verrucomicrobiaceae bacterium]|nr:hypothetical protein [Verrucomicrobiaceae bacterium]